MRRSRGLVLVLLSVLLLASATATGAPSPDHVRFTAAGDYGSTGATTSVVRAIGESDPDAHFALGDLSYGQTGAEQDWCDLVTEGVGEGFPFELVAGNHESNGLNGNINDFSACLPNQLPGLVGTYGRQYFVDVPQEQPLVRFVMVSPGLTFADGRWDYEAGTARYAWLARAIDSAREQGVPWVVVGMHKPCLTVGQYTCDIGPDILHLLLSRKVDLVLAGHEHNYQRTKQLGLAQGCQRLEVGGYNEDCVRDSDDDLVAGAGTVFTTIGTGGIGQRDIDALDEEASYFAALNGPNLDLAYGFSEFDVTPTTLGVRFVPTGGATYQDAFTITRDPNAPPNEPPTAAFTATPTELAVDFDASGSDDADGFLTDHAWDFGDGASGTGESPRHTYSRAGTYDVTLTVTDDDGSTGTVTQPVTVTAPAEQVIAADSFQRDVSAGWGSADVGGPWSVGTANGISFVSEGLGRLLMRIAGARPVAMLNGVSAADLEVTYEFSLNKLPTGNNARVDQSLVLRKRSAGEYRGVVRVLPDGSVRVFANRVLSGGGTTVLGSIVTVPGVTYAPDDVLRVRTRLSGNPAQVEMKVWEAGTPEPGSWSLVRTDTSTALSGAGSLGLGPYLASTATNAPVRASFDELKVVSLTPAP